MSYKILIMGLPGSGKTTLAAAIVDFLVSVGKTVEWYNADQVRQKNNDWDFSLEGRIRQSMRMRELADAAESDFVVCDFVAPLPEMRSNFAPNYVIWLDTIKESEYEDTNQIFVPPAKYNFYVPTKDSPHWSGEIVKHLLFLNSHNQ